MSVKSLLTRYAQLPELPKALLRLKALLYFKVSEEVLRKCLSNLPYLFSEGGLLPIQDFRDQIAFLKQEGFLDKSGVLLRSLIHPLTIEAVDCEHSQQYIKAVQSVSSLMGSRLYQGGLWQEVDRNTLRLAIYTHQNETYEEALANLPPHEVNQVHQRFFLEEVLDIAWLKRIPVLARILIMELKVHTFFLTGRYNDQIPNLVAYFEDMRSQHSTMASFDQGFILYDIFHGRIPQALQSLQTAKGHDPSTIVLKGVALFLGGHNEEAISSFEEALRRFRKLEGRKRVSLDPIGTLFYCLALLRAHNRQTYQKVHTLLDILREARWRDYSIKAFERVLLKLQGAESRTDSSLLEGYETLAPVPSALSALADYWFAEGRIHEESCKKQFRKYQKTFPLVAKIFAEILEKISPDPVYKAYLNEDRMRALISLVDCVRMGESWERALETLDHYLDKQGAGTIPTSKRLVWYFNPATKYLEAVEQSLQARGIWSKGRAVSLKRLYDGDPKIDYLTEEDRRVIKTLTVEKGWHGYMYEWHPSKTCLALVGHPCVYHADTPTLRLELVKGSPQLLVKEQEGGKFHISLSHTAFEPRIFLDQETPSRYRVVQVTKSLLPISEILGARGLTVPAQAKDQLVSIIQKASPLLPVHSEADLVDIPAQEGDKTPHIHITPLDQGLKLNLLVRPFGNRGPYFPPGHGKPSLLIFDKAETLKAKRSLKEEREKANALIQSCSALSSLKDGIDEWVFSHPQDCLEVLSQLQELKEVRVEWPEGQKMSVTSSTSFERLSLKISHQQDWLSVQGSLKIDENTVMDLGTLLKLMEQGQGRFIPLSPHKYVALSSHFKKQLQELKSLMEETAEGHRIHRLGGLYLDTFAAQASHVEGDKKWKETVKAFRKSQAYDPPVPSTLQATLREYQQEGFKWLSRLAHGGFGACLADDMGLGKTLQALAVMLNYAAHGPCLVIAPTSVCHNWKTEIKKFAPTLAVHTLDTGKREAVVTALGANDVLICSYTLLQQEEDLLKSQPWQMIVLDEAQAIKNASTRRFQAAIKLQGQFRLALTGTPIENNLEELWSLFRFINPGLLGSKESFHKRFLTAESEEEAKRKKAGLKGLIQLFMLRRTKNNVLQELPPRTEQTVMVEMLPEEIAFYEALRRQAVTNISGLEQQGGQRKIHILAEITRLRRACCHSSLASQDIILPSSKLRTFLHLVDDLIQNNHQALVFSQYVSFLKMIRQELDQKGISYQYLDGSTPAVERQNQVQAFQEGKSPLFLLSLKAGGSGLNLTAADYVIHLDPWWNPAVEDQASDRAYRLGQKRPVTIYRLVAQNTIEEKMIALHKDKRDLAEELLEGSDLPQKLTEEDLLNLIAA